MSISGVGGGAAMMRRFQPPTFSSLDSNSSGDLTLDELKSGAPGGAADAKSAARAEKLFKAMDADSSGSVSSDEKDAFDAKLAERQQAMGFMAQQMAGGMPPPPPSNEDVFAATDKDASGSVSLEEFSESQAAEELSSDQLSELFSTIDADGDGAISETESSDFLDTLKAAAGGPPPPGGPGGGPGGPGGPPPGGPPPSASAEESEEEEDTTAIDLLTAATSAYSSSQKSSDLLATLTSIFDQAA